MNIPSGDIPTRAMPEITGDPPAKLRLFRIRYRGSTTIGATNKDEARAWFEAHMHGAILSIRELPE